MYCVMKPGEVSIFNQLCVNTIWRVNSSLVYINYVCANETQPLCRQEKIHFFFTQTWIEPKKKLPKKVHKLQQI